VTSFGATLYDQFGPASSFLTVLNQTGQTTTLPTTDPTGGWETETALDVEWAHAMAPGALIVLVEASSQSLADLMAGVATAAHQPGVSVVSMSWGFTENAAVFAGDEAIYDRNFIVPGVTFIASTGDFGAASLEYPAFSPNVLAVGGTSLTLNGASSYQSETGWGYFDSSLGMLIGSGGGLSRYEPEPAFQLGVQTTGARTTPDVSLVADPNTGAWITDPFNLPADNPFEVVGGTSLSAPTWAGLIALANQGRVAIGEPTLNSVEPTAIQQALYALPQSDFNIIQSGSNGFSAGPNYNLVTGLGTPVADRLVPELIAYQGPGTIATGSPTVSPIQDVNLINTAEDSANAAGPANALHPFNFEIRGAQGFLNPQYGEPATAHPRRMTAEDSLTETGQSSPAILPLGHPVTVSLAASELPFATAAFNLALIDSAGNQTRLSQLPAFQMPPLAGALKSALDAVLASWVADQEEASCIGDRYEHDRLASPYAGSDGPSANLAAAFSEGATWFNYLFNLGEDDLPLA